MRDHRREPYLQALDVPAARSKAAGRHSGDDVAALLPTADVVYDEQPVAEVDGQRDSRVRDRPQVDDVRGPIAESGHAHPRKQAGPRRGPRCPRWPQRHEPTRQLARRQATSHLQRSRVDATFLQDATAGHATTLTAQYPDRKGPLVLRSPIDPFTPAVELAAAIRRKEVSPVEVVDSYLERMDRLDCRLNAFCHRADDDVRNAASAQRMR